MPPSPLHPILDGPPTRKARSSGIAAMLVVLLVVMGVWLVSGGDPGTPSGADSRYADTSDSGGASGAAGRDLGTDPASGLPVVALSSLPPQVAQVADLIDAGGPFPYEEDGSTFGNYEDLLPPADRGDYQEYTVATPGSSDRGARRLVQGDDGALFWTSDHYASFSAVQR